MNTKKSVFRIVFIIGAGLFLAGQMSAQTFTNLYNFSTQHDTANFTPTNSDGSSPYNSLIVSGNTLYGTAERDGLYGNGTIFAISTTGTGFTNLHNFSATTTYNGFSTNVDGAYPYGNLILSNNVLYGTTSQGGANGAGTVFAIPSNGMGFTNLHNFSILGFGATGLTNNDGDASQCGLVLAGNTLYGTTAGGGTNGNGTIFAVNTDGTGFRLLHTFLSTDGMEPIAGMILSTNILYGTTFIGGTNGNGTIFAINTNGNGFTSLHSFNGGDGNYAWAGLLLSSNTLYGTTESGGSSSRGTIFAINTDGTGFTNLYNFPASNYNTKGANPYGTLILSGNILYGTTSEAGSNADGTVFAFTLGSTNTTTLYTFSGGDGRFSYAGLVLNNNILYGAAELGGSFGNGTIFSLSLLAGAPQLNISISGTNAILTWTAIGYTLQSITNLVSPIWITVPGQNMVTDSISGSSKFYRLTQ